MQNKLWESSPSSSSFLIRVGGWVCLSKQASLLPHTTTDASAQHNKQPMNTSYHEGKGRRGKGFRGPFQVGVAALRASFEYTSSPLPSFFPFSGSPCPPPPPPLSPPPPPSLPLSLEIP